LQKRKHQRRKGEKIVNNNNKEIACKEQRRNIEGKKMRDHLALIKQQQGKKTNEERSTTFAKQGA